jgi:cytochrome c
MSNVGRRIAWAMALALLAGPLVAKAEGDPAKGKKVFNKCRTCHVVDAEQNKVGPNLVGLFGREAGSVEGFKYSDAMMASGIVWEDETITAYVKDPKAYVPGNRMVFPGLRKDQEIEDLLAYLRQETGG